MSSSFADSFDELGGDSFPSTGDGYLGGSSDSPIFAKTISPPQIYSSGGGLSQELNGDTFSGGFAASIGRDEGVSLREWRRENTIRLEEKERREKKILSQIVAEAEDYKVDFHNRRKVDCETNKVTNREKEKILVANLEKVHAEADKNYWKTIAELIPNEVVTIEKKREKKGEEKKPSIAVVKGPKPGKPTDLSRMRHILLKLKHETPSHLKLSTPVAPTKDAKTDVAVSVSAPPKDPTVATPVEAVAVA